MNQETLRRSVEQLQHLIPETISKLSDRPFSDPPAAREAALSLIVLADSLKAAAEALQRALDPRPAPFDLSRFPVGNAAQGMQQQISPMPGWKPTTT
jgi:hypothetical protein